MKRNEIIIMHYIIILLLSITYCILVIDVYYYVLQIMSAITGLMPSHVKPVHIEVRVMHR